MSRKIDKENLQRYMNPEVVNHLASNYVLGQLTPIVRRRVDALRNNFDFNDIEKKINYWEQKLSPLNDSTQSVKPLPESWEKIQARLNMTSAVEKSAQEQNQKESFLSWQSLSMWRFSGVFSLIFCVALGFSLLQQEPNLGELSYIAVLEDAQSDNSTPQVVASTYGDSKKLVLDILTLPDIDEEESFELWVTSKTDNQTRSLGEIPKGKSLFARELTDAEWRLIADSSYLIISVEDEGGSPIGEPSDSVISRGLCIRLEGRGQPTSA